nr:MAG TPA: hypothetical protein [Caudoviricetes sp.]
MLSQFSKSCSTILKCYELIVIINILNHFFHSVYE